MKHFSKLLGAITFILAAVLTGCSTKTTPAPLPTGNFTGQFIKIHLTPSTGKFDTVKANLNLTLNAATGFTVTGDTSTVHAGSYGAYAVSGSVIEFVDKTATTANLAKNNKIHLNGDLQYAYDGTNLQMFSSNDTLGYNYIFKVQ